MIKNTIFILSAMVIFSTFHHCHAQCTIANDIKEIWLYDYFSPKGYTRGEVYSKFQELENDNVQKHKLDDSFVDSLKHVLCRAKNKKILDGKCGTNLIFAQFVMQDDDCRNIIIGTNGISDYFNLRGLYFDDVTKNKYWIDYYNKITDIFNNVNHSKGGDWFQNPKQVDELKVCQFSELPEELFDNLDKMGVDVSLTLNEHEGRCLNYMYQYDKDTFDFGGKRVAFLKGNIGTLRSNKKEYFDRLKQYVQSKGILPTCPDQLIILDENEVKLLGYDAVIVSSSKKSLTSKDVIKRLRK